VLEHGFHFSLYNNKWGTHHPAWFSEDARFRFSLHFDKSILIGESTLVGESILIGESTLVDKS